MDWLLSKFGEIKKGGLEAFFLLLSSFVFLDWISINVWKANLIDKIAKISFFEIAYTIMLYFCAFYFLKLIRFLITNLIVIRFNQQKFDKEYFNSKKKYYYLDDLLKESIQENNNVKYQNYLRLHSQNETQNNLKTFAFITVFMIIVDCISPETILRTLLNYRIVLSVIILFGLACLYFGLQLDKDDDTNTYIRREDFEIQK